MISLISVTFLFAICHGDDYYYRPSNVTRSSLSGLEAYRSALTLDWMAAEDQRQRELVAAFETEPSPPARILTTDCIGYARPASGKVARLMLELLKNLEGDEGTIIPELIQVLIRNKLLVETSMLDAEPDLEALVKTPGIMMGEPHATFPRILAMAWMTITDPVATKKTGWCPVKKVTQYLSATKPFDIAKHMRALDPVLARGRFIMEEFIQHVTPINMYQKKELKEVKAKSVLEKTYMTGRGTSRSSETVRPGHLVLAQARSTPTRGPHNNIIDAHDIVVEAASPASHQLSKMLAISDILLWTVLWPSVGFELDLDTDMSEDRWIFRSKQEEPDHSCVAVRSSAKDIIRRFYAIVPYFDKDHANTAFLHKFRGTVYGMSDAEDMLDREAGFYAAVLTPLVFLQQYRDTWCLLERFHRALRLYQISHPTEKRSALKLLQNLRAVNQKIRSFILDLPGPVYVTRTTSTPDMDEEELHDKKDIRYLKELIKNLG